MQNRQRELIGFILFGTTPTSGIGKLRLTKYAFLLAQEATDVPASLRYDFVPYHYGPFSFSLYNDLNAIGRDGFITSSGDDEGLTIADHMASAARTEFDQLPWSLRAAIHDTCARYRSISDDELLRVVYSRHPWYAMCTKRRDLVSGPPVTVQEASIAAYTVGYEGKSIEGFLRGLLNFGIKRIIDVRYNPVSRKYGFSGAWLREKAKGLGLEYEHVPQLGIPGEDRRELGTVEAYDRLLDRYEREMLPAQTQAIARVASLLGERASALMCMEADPNRCHRSRLAQTISVRTGMPVTHLG